MASKAKEKIGNEKSEDTVVKFKCHVCGKERPIQEMRTITRFVPVLVACQECAKHLR
jgi:translation initiation factor 2 beta subunit (eIF-2beta)/eIF-5